MAELNVQDPEHGQDPEHVQDPERRHLEFQQIDEAIAEAQRLADGDVRTVGNHSFAEILHHLALSADMATGRIEAPRPPWLLRLMMPLIRRQVVSDKPLAPGVKLPKKVESVFWPGGELDVQEQLEYFADAMRYFAEHGPLPKHPFFGELARRDNERLALRHCALHLGFVHPVSAVAN